MVLGCPWRSLQRTRRASHAYRKKARSACAATETDLRFHPAAPFIARNSSTSSTLTRANNRCRSPTQLRNFGVFQQCDRTDCGDSPCSSVHIEGEVAELISEPRARRTRRFQASVEAKPLLRCIDKEGSRVAVRMRIRI